MAFESDSRNSHRHYDLSMSRRTRRPASSSSSSQSQNEEKKESSDELHHTSLKELITEESRGLKELITEESRGAGKYEGGNANVYQSDGVHSNKVAGGETEEDKSLPVVVVEEVKTSSMVSHCVKVLKHLIKAKRTTPKKKKNQKNVVPLLMQ
uniref:Uncharacterized protein n=1 Tax=Ananas comosus var. bracteatus TaxID=296719 RepID=A0A6V7NIG7_ANACO|nr:unnamed protein product [Ananas comosus var. bracteatus]